MQEKSNFHYQQIYDTLKSEILDESLRSGDLIPPENQIAQQYGVNRSTVRKALQMLVNDGLVEKKPGKGSIVLNRDAAKRSPSPSPAAASASYRNIGFLLPSGNAITQPFYSTLFFVLEREFKRFNFSLIYSTFNEQDDLLKTCLLYTSRCV